MIGNRVKRPLIHPQLVGFGFVVFILYCIPIAATLESIDAHFYDTLFQDYRSELRPVFDFNQSIYVNILIRLDSILGLDSKSQSLQVLAELAICWREPRLSWNLNSGPMAYVVPVSTVWIPDIVLRNSLSASPIDVSQRARPYIFNWGYVCLKFFSRIETSCSIDVRKFPFDTQECQIQLSIPRSAFDKVKFGSHKIFDRENTESGDWVLQNIVVEVIQESDDDNDEEIVAVKVKISRHSSTHLVNTLLPLIGLFFLNPFVFFMPTGHGERISFSTSLLLSYAVTISSLAEVLPGSKEHVCYLSVMASVCFFVSSFIAILVIVISKIDDRQGLCDKAWGLLILYLFYEKRRKTANKIDVLKAREFNTDVNGLNPDGINEKTNDTKMETKDNMYKDNLKENPLISDSFSHLDSSMGTWQEVASCLNRLAFRVILIMSFIIVVLFLVLMCM